MAGNNKLRIRSPQFYCRICSQVQRLSMRLSFLNLHGELLSLPLIHRAKIRNSHLRAVESSGLSKNRINGKSSSNKLPAVPWFCCWSLPHPGTPSDTCHSTSKVAGEMCGVNGHTHLQLQLNNPWNGWENTERTVSLLSSSGKPVALPQGQGEYWSGWRISAKHFKVCTELKGTYFYNSTLGIINLSANFLDKNDDFDCYISDIQSRIS